MKLNRLREFLLGLPRGQKRIIQLIVDVLITWLALWLSYAIRLGIEDTVSPLGEHYWLFIWASLISVPIYARFGLYRAVMRYIGNDALIAIFKAVTLATVGWALIVYWFRAPEVLVPRSLVFIFWWVQLLLIGSVRLLSRQYFLGHWYIGSAGSESEVLPRVAIYGAGAAGNQLLAALRLGRTLRPVAFIDDDANLSGQIISGLKVYSSTDISRLIEATGAQEVLLALPSVSRQRRRQILQALEGYPLHVRTIPSFMDLASGRVTVSDLQDVDVGDLLGRDPVGPQVELFERCIKGLVVLVTGAGGSIGSELCRQIVSSGPATLILLEHSEYNLYSVESELERLIAARNLPTRLVSMLGNVRDGSRLQEIFQNWRVNTVYHAAAYKHVPIVERNVAQGIFNNVEGTLNAALAAIKTGVQHFVLISTDKAVRPTNVMGGTKRLAEMILQALAAETAPKLGGADAQVRRTRFTMVRFGNVLGSSGSVIPLFRQQIKRGGPVTVTHSEITRYFMTIPEAAQLVIQAGALGQGGDVFVLDMGQPVRIATLAEKMILLSGLTVRSQENPNGDIAIEFSGLRPGEKLYEELLIGDNVMPTEHSMIMRANEDFLSWDELRSKLDALFSAARSDDYQRVRQLLCELVAGYVPEEDIVDLFHSERGCAS